jgi:hypothetical protein
MAIAIEDHAETARSANAGERSGFAVKYGKWVDPRRDTFKDGVFTITS